MNAPLSGLPDLRARARCYLRLSGVDAATIEQVLALAGPACDWDAVAACARSRLEQTPFAGAAPADPPPLLRGHIGHAAGAGGRAA